MHYIQLINTRINKTLRLALSVWCCARYLATFVLWTYVECKRAGILLLLALMVIPIDPFTAITVVPSYPSYCSYGIRKWQTLARARSHCATTTGRSYVRCWTHMARYTSTGNSSLCWLFNRCACVHARVFASVNVDAMRRQHVVDIIYNAECA